MTEPELLTNLRRNDPAACKSLVDLYGSLVFGTALGLLQNRADAEDTAQEVFAKAFQTIGLFRGESKISTWLYRITVTKSLELLRAKKRKKRFGFMVSLFEPNSVKPATDLPHFDHPGVLAENSERAAILFAAIEKLPENQKSAFLLHKMEDVPYAEIAEILGVTGSSVESLLFRAKQNLRKLLGDYYEKNER